MNALVSFDTACATMFELIQPLGKEYQDTRFAENFVLAQDVQAIRTSPPTALSAMDGYAVRSQDVNIGTNLIVIGKIAAGTSATGLTLVPGTAARIFTGAPLPQGADAVLIQENTNPADQPGHIVATNTVDPGRFVRAKGLDFTADDVLLPAGTKLGAAQIGLLLSAGVSKVLVQRHPSIEILSTGDELVEVEDWRVGDDTRLPSSNGAMIRAVLGRYGLGSFVQPIVPDTLDALAQRFDALKHDTDLIITSGGASVGEHDIVRQFLDDHADEIHVQKIAMRPGKPVMLARVQGVWWLALPGNPVSSFVTATIFAVGIARRLCGDTAPWPQYQHGVLASNVAANDHRLEFMRATNNNGRLSPFDAQDSSMMLTLALANALVERPANAPEMPAGTAVRYLPI